MKRKLLVVSIAMPPKNDPECIQTGRYVKSLSALGEWEISAVTSGDKTLFMPLDKTLESYVEGINLVKVPVFESKLTNVLLRKLYPSLMSSPDSKMTFHWQWKSVLKKVERPDVIYSRSNPLSSTIMALKLKKHFNVPWVLHLSDPWTESPLHVLTGLDKERHESMERESFSNADLISFTTKQTIALYSEKYPDFRSKFFLSPNVYDTFSMEAVPLPARLEARRNDKIRIVYTGGLANTRNAGKFLRAVQYISDTKKGLMDRLEVLFAGDMDSNNRQLFESFVHLGCVKHLGVLSQKDAIALQESADILLVIDSEIDESSKNVFLPSKLLDYHVRKKWILALTNKESPTMEFLSEGNGVGFSFDNYLGLGEYLISVLNNSEQIPSVDKLDDFYSSEYQARLLSSEMLKLL